MVDNSKDTNANVNKLLTPFRYISIGFFAVLGWTKEFFKYLCLGSYYALVRGILRPLNKLFTAIGDLIFLMSNPNKKMKKDKALEIEMNYDEKGEKISSANMAKKDIYTQMKENQLKKINKKVETKISAKEKEKMKTERDTLLKSINDGQEKRLEKPQTFKYKALSQDGKIVNGTFVGVSKLDIYTFLTGEGYTVYSIETSDWINFVYGQSLAIHTRMSTKDLIFFITQLSTYIKSGITLTEAMRILSKQLNKNKSQQRIMQSIVYYLTMGESFSSALNKQNGAFPQFLINMIKAAEATGNLEEALDDMSEYYSDINSTRKQMITAMSYPTFVGLFSLVIIIIIMLTIVPKFVGIYASAGAKLNPLTQFIISFSDFLKQYISIIALLLALGLFLLFMTYKQVKAFRMSVQVFMMKLPVIGNIIIYNELTIFTKTFASLLKNDVFITDSIEILSNLTKNEIYKDIMLNTISNIAKGEKISESFKNHWAIPDVAYYMIVTGENTGQLATMMSKVSAYYQEQHRTMINSLKSLIEPAMIIFLALIVGSIMIAVILPMFELYNNVPL